MKTLLALILAVTWGIFAFWMQGAIVLERQRYNEIAACRAEKDVMERSFLLLPDKWMRYIVLRQAVAAVNKR